MQQQPAGWYRDSERPNLHRYWTGESWSDWVGEERAVAGRARVPDRSATAGTTSGLRLTAAVGPVASTRWSDAAAPELSPGRVPSADRSRLETPAGDVLVLGHHLAGDRLRAGRRASHGGGLGARMGESGRHEADLDLGPASRRGADDGTVVGEELHGLIQIDL